MGPPVFELPLIPFDASKATEVSNNHQCQNWILIGIREHCRTLGINTESDSGELYPLSVLSMGNPHAVTLVDDVETAPVASLGPWIEHHSAFPKRVNVGFMQIQSKSSVKLRVFERGAGETLACGTGACAAVVAGIQQGLLDSRVDVQTRGGTLTIEWSTGHSSTGGSSVFMTGPAVSVFKGNIEINE
jgi:diaminopimelate epimerase